MLQAYILVSIERGKEQDINDTLLGLPEVTGSHIVFGEWDLIAKVRLEGSEALSTFILDNIRPIEGVKLTSTLIVAK